MNQTTRRHLLPLGAAIALAPSLLTVAPRKALANTRAEIDGEVASALRTLRAHDNTRPLFAQAKSILIFPRILSGGFIVGGQYGQGALIEGGFVRKIAHIDLMAIRDPEGRARVRGDRPADALRDRFTFPFFTIENVAAVDGQHIIVGNDNNLPFSAGRHFFQADANEFILLRVPELLNAR